MPEAKMRLIELCTQEGEIVRFQGEAWPVRAFQDNKLKTAIGALLLEADLRQEHKETLDQFASRVRRTLLQYRTDSVLDCLRGRMLLTREGEDRRKVQGVLAFALKNGGHRPVYLFGPWLWFSECKRLARKRRIRYHQ